MSNDWQRLMREVAARTEPTPEMLAKVRAGLAARAAPSPWSWAGPAVVGAVGLAALGLWALDAPDLEPAVEARVQLAPEVQLLGDVPVRVAGFGEALGGGRDWTLDWTQGSVALDLPAGGGHRVELRTPEAVIRVVGSAFEVDRTALGTRVAAGRDGVEVACVAGPRHTLVAGASTTCLPATATGLLGRARALEEGGAPADQVLSALDAGLALAPEPAVFAELQAQRIGPLAAAGRHEDALAAAEAVIAAGGPRAEQAQHAAAALAWSLGGCDRAPPHLERIGRPTESELAWIEACR